ncbi:MAG: fibronectin type III domain-containing protein [Acidobacteria bacterium]|nr:fibronectin type III domain-containing protein [Acidobacteriota bacterium]
MMNLTDQRTKPHGSARLARAGQATLALALALLAGAGTAAAQDTLPPELEYARINGTTLTLRFDKGVQRGPTWRQVQGFTVDGISDSASVHPTAMTWLDGRVATFELDTRAEPGQTVTVSYDPDKVPYEPPSWRFPEGRNMALRYTDLTLVPAFSGAPVTILIPRPATDLTLSEPVGRNIDLSWTLPAQPEGVVVTKLRVNSGMTTPGSTSDCRVLGGASRDADVTSVTMPIFHGGFTHCFSVTLYTDNYEADSEIVSWTSTQDGLKSPTGLTASNATQTTVDLAWTLPEQAAWVTQEADNMWSVLRQQEADGTWSTLDSLAADAEAHTVTGLSAGTAYTFHIALRQPSLISPSKPVSVTTLAATTQTPKSPLTASFHDVPASHSGEAFTFGLKFSEEVKLGYKKLRDEAFDVTGGTVTSAGRQQQGSNLAWNITVKPASANDTVTITLPETTDCNASGAICTADSRPLSHSTSATVLLPPVINSALTASFSSMPASHSGKAFTFGLEFSEEVKLGFKKLRDEAFDVTGGTVTNAGRQQQGSNLAWNITVKPASANDTVTITLPETTDCNASGAICTADARPLSHSLSATVIDAASASAGDAANGDAADDPLALAEDALAIANGLTPDEATQALFGERRLSEAQLTALDRLGNRNGSYDLGDVLSWIDRCGRGEASCGGTSTDSGPAAAAALPAAVRGGGTSRRAGGRAPGPRRPRSPVRRERRRKRGTVGYGVMMLLAATMTWSCTDDAVGPTAAEPDPGFLTVELNAPAANRDIGVLLELEGPGIETVRASGFELYESVEREQHQIVVAGSLRSGPLVQFEVPDRNQLSLYRVHVLQVTGEDYGLRDADEYRAVLTN